VARTPRRLGFDDGVIVPPEEFPFGTSLARIRDAAAERAPLRGTVRVIAVLVDFSDKAMTTTADHSAFSHTATPNSDSYTGQDTCVSITAISGSAPTMSASITVRCGKGVAKDLKDGPKDFKEPWKDRKDLKESFKDFKEPWKDRKEQKEPFKDHKEIEQPAGPAASAGDETAAALADLGTRVAAIEDLLGMGGGQQGGVEPFIGSELRPDLVGGPTYGPTPALEDKMRAAEGGSKRAFDTGPPA
jgi:immune inhibitor A